MDFTKPTANTFIENYDSGQLESPIETRMIPKELIAPSENGQVRKEFNEQKIASLRDNIKRVGQIEPITVEADPTGNGFIIVTGERRWRAIKGIDEISEIMCVIREFSDDKQRYAVQLSENFDREDLSVVDRAMAIDKLVNMYGGDVELAAKSIGKSRSTLLKMSSVLHLPDKGKSFVKDGFTTDYSSISMLKTLFKLDENKANFLIDKYRRKEDDRPLREALRTEIDNISNKKQKTTRSKQQTLTANEIFMQENTDKLYIVHRSGLITIKLDKIDDDIKEELFHTLNEEDNA